MRRTAALCLCLLSWGCTTHDYENEQGRIGGPLPDSHVDLPDGSEEDAALPDSSAGAADAADAADADAGPPLIAFCEAFRVMKVCRRCHQVPSPVGAPFPLQRWEDTQALHLNRVISDRMIQALETNFMPLRTSTIQPPIQALDPSCKNTLLTWLKQGAKPVGGTDCDPNLSCEGCPNFP
jgi:hypothetical protein